MHARWFAFLIFGMALGGAGGLARAETRLNAHFVISMTGVPIGQITWTADFGATVYTTAANGKASGALSMLVNGEGRVATRGTIDNAGLKPTQFSSGTTEDGETVSLQMLFENNVVKTLRTNAPPATDGRIPVSEADQRDVADPLSAMLMMAPPDAGGLMPSHCERTLKVFDGQRRYDLILSFKRLTSLKIEHGFAGPVLICAVVLKPISGYRAESLLVKYVGGRQGLEIWFAPVTGTSIVAPAKLVMPTLLGTLEIAADRFDISTPEPAVTSEPLPSPAPPAVAPTAPRP